MDKKLYFFVIVRPFLFFLLVLFNFHFLLFLVAVKCNTWFMQTSKDGKKKAKKKRQNIKIGLKKIKQKEKKKNKIVRKKIMLIAI